MFIKLHQNILIIKMNGCGGTINVPNNKYIMSTFARDLEQSKDTRCGGTSTPNPWKCADVTRQCFIIM